MNNSNLVHEPVEQALVSAIGDVKRFANESLQQTESYVRESPEKAVAYSLGIGFILSFLPVCGLIALIIRLMRRLIRPVLFVLGAAKVYELAVACCKNSPKSDS